MLSCTGLFGAPSGGWTWLAWSQSGCEPSRVLFVAPLKGGRLIASTYRSASVRLWILVAVILYALLVPRLIIYSYMIVIVPVLALLQAKYGIGKVTIEHPHPLSAPQATLMASLASGVFGEGLPWSLVGLGAMIGAGVILLDHRQATRDAAFRLPVLAVALGIYLPLKLSAAIFVGGLIAEFARRRGADQEARAAHQGLLFAAGLVTGEALMGILLALPIALNAVWPALGTDPLKLFDNPPLGAWPGVAILAAVAALLYRIATYGRNEPATSNGPGQLQADQKGQPTRPQ